MMTSLTLSPVRTLAIVLCLICTLRFARAGFERSCSTDRHTQAPKGLCGGSLSMILSTVCRMYNKRGSPALMSPLKTTSSDAEMLADNSIFLPKREALSFFKRELVVSGTITCECCIHRCGIMELRQYCSVAEPLKKRNGRGNGASETHHKGALVQKELSDIAQKRHIGQQLLRDAPSWWESVNKLSESSAHAHHPNGVTSPKQEEDLKV